MENQTIKHREWVKTAAIIFLSVLLVLTFFSNTIMNRSLPEVAAQYVQSGTINAKIRGSGTISANETYDVTLSQTRKIRSVLVKVGQEVSTGDTLFTLEAADSDELKQAQDTLSQMEADYQKSLITLSNDSSTENRDIQKLREDYNEALTIFRLYSNSDPTTIAVALKTAEAELKNLQREAEDAQNAYANASSDSAYTDAQAQVTTCQTEVSTLDATIKEYEASLDDNYPKDISEVADEIRNVNREIADAEDKQDNLNHSGETMNLYKEFIMYTKNVDYVKAVCASDASVLLKYIEQSAGADPSKKTLEYAQKVVDAYQTVTDLESTINGLNNKKSALENQKATLENLDVAEKAKDRANDKLEAAKQTVKNWESDLQRLKDNSTRAQQAAEDQKDVVDNLQTASTAGETLKTAQQALEDKVFTANLGDTNAVDLQRSKEALEEQRKTVEKLSADSDGEEVKAKVSGVISAINVTAGNNAGADTAIATITVADRGYTVQISVTNDQARQVKIGDTAEITNFWNGNLTATLENITNDPKNMGNGKLLVFRLTGDGAEAGTNLTLSIGQKSANYDTLIPNSAVRSDANGSFVLVVVAKSSPLGNRYVATRADIQVLASDDTTSAVSGLANGDFVITTSTEPIEAGKQVRLVDNG